MVLPGGRANTMPTKSLRGLDDAAGAAGAAVAAAVVSVDSDTDKDVAEVAMGIADVRSWVPTWPSAPGPRYNAHAHSSTTRLVA